MPEGPIQRGKHFRQTETPLGFDAEIYEILHDTGVSIDSFTSRQGTTPKNEDLILDQQIADILARPVPDFNLITTPRWNVSDSTDGSPRSSGNKRKIQEEPSVRQKLRAASGLPDGPIIPDTVRQVAGDIADAAVAHKARVAAGAAVIVAGSMTLSPLFQPPGSSAVQRAGSTLTERSKIVVSEQSTSQPELAEIVQVSFEYTPEVPTTPKQIANAMQASSEEIANNAQQQSVNTLLKPGQKVGGTVQASKMKLLAPMGVDQLALAYGLPREAILSVNQPNEHGLLVDEVLIPGRQVVQYDQVERFNPEVIATSLSLSEVGKRELQRVNQNAPAGQLVLPLSPAIQKHSEQTPALAVAAAVIEQPQNTVDNNSLGSAPTTTSSVPASTETTVSPSSSIDATTIPDTDPEDSTSTSVQGSIKNPALESDVSNTSTANTTTSLPIEVVPVTPPAGIEQPIEEPVAPQVTIERPASAAEKMTADIEALGQALDHLLMTGDAGPANHIVTYSPIFSTNDLPAELQNKGYRLLPPANLLNLPGLQYEISPDTPDNERYATSNIIVTVLAASYALEAEKQLHPEIAQAYPDACIRVGDLSALDGHQSHAGPNVDLTSVMQCNVQAGHQTADGPVFWINKSSTGIDRTVTNKNYNALLDGLLMQRLLNLQIDGQPLVKNILYNAPKMTLPGVKLHDNHSNHIHINGFGSQDQQLKRLARGGGRPELNLDAVRAKIFQAYDNGGGIDGISRGLMVQEVVPPVTSNPPQLEPSDVSMAQTNPPQQDAIISVAPPVDSTNPALATEVDYRTVLPVTADIPPQFMPFIVPSKHFTAIELAAQIKAESRFNPLAKSPVGAKGLAQFMPGTWEALGQDTPLDPDTQASPYNAVEVLDAQRRYMDGLYEQIVSLQQKGLVRGDARQLTLAAYNAGIGNVKKYGGMPPFAETKKYVKNIDLYIQEYVQYIDAERNQAG